jgi:hypothetical protein
MISSVAPEAYSSANERFFLHSINKRTSLHNVAASVIFRLGMIQFER